MGRHDSRNPEDWSDVDIEEDGLDFRKLAVDVDQFRECMRALVAGLVTDGFTEREARALVAGVFAGNVDRGETA